MEIVAMVSVLALSLVNFAIQKRQIKIDKHCRAQDSALSELLSETEMLHKRLKMTNERIMQVEHYIGLRSHSFQPGQRMWDYHQIAKDLSSELACRPESIHAKRKKAA